ncbi:LmeA family phospholipid-binding protein [Kineosporiaceae bacterium SCSIO 59966]|nr:LmeA family phospholipid-binding protein [Kineosporiaceae bacterium SCSIO 59966]
MSTGRRVLVGVGVLLLAVVVAAGVLFWSVSRPADDAASDAGPADDAGSPAAAPAPPPPPGAPEDLAAGDLWLDEMTLRSSDVLAADGRLRDLSLEADDVLLGSGGVRAGVVVADAVVPFEVVADQVGPGTAVSAAASGEVRVERTVTLLGRQVDVVATGTVRAEDGEVVVVPTAVDVGGPDWLADLLGELAAAATTIRQPVQGLPEELVLQTVEVTDGGFAVHLTGEDVPLGR